MTREFPKQVYAVQDNDGMILLFFKLEDCPIHRDGVEIATYDVSSFGILKRVFTLEPKQEK